MRFILAVEINSNTKSKQQAIILLNNAENLNALSLNVEMERWLKQGNLKIGVDTTDAIDHSGLGVVNMIITHSSGKVINKTNYLIRRN